jgi:hypothetical protein
MSKTNESKLYALLKKHLKDVHFTRIESHNRPLLQRALKIYSGSIVREPITSDTEPLATFNEPIDWIALKDLLFTAGEPRTSDKSRPTSA